MYKAIYRFRDLTDGHLYEVSDVFPHDGREIPAERLNALLTGKNLAGKPLIAAVEEDHEEQAEAPKKPARARKKTS